MELASVNYQCPACGGPLRYDGARGCLVCDYCGSEHDVAQVEAAYAAKEEAESAKAGGAGAEAASRGYVCSSCAAELVADETTAVSQCPYCGNPVVMEAQLSGDFSPDLVIPFKLDHKRAVEALSAHYKGKVLLPRSFKAGNHIEEVQGVYVPFWLYDARARGTARIEATKVRRYEQGDDEVTETEYYDVFREGEGEFARVPVDGSSKMPDGHMDAIEPFDYEELRPYSSAYMPGFMANRWDEDAETCRERARARIDASVVGELEQDVAGYDSASVVSSEVSCDWAQTSYALLPVWMLSTSWEGKSFLFAMNGQTGKLVGDLPVSKPKLVGILAAVFFVLFAVLWFGAGLSRGGGASSVAIAAGVPAAVAVIVGVLLWNQMKTARVATQADAYLDEGSFEVTSRQDSYRTTITTRSPRQRDGD